MLDLPKWKRKRSIIAKRITLDEAVKLAEEVKGVKFDLKYFSAEKIEPSENDLRQGMKKTLPKEIH